MSFGIARVQKMKAGAVKGIKMHDEREKDVSHTNPDINREKSGENYALQTSDNWSQDIKHRIGELELPKAPRHDAVVMCQVLITSDRDFFDKLTPEQEKEFFEDAFKFVQAKYGAENIIAATVHKDEKTPHMHVNFMPVTADGRLSAKSLFTRETLRGLQDDFHRQVGKKWGLERGESREDKRTHLKTEEYKLKTGWDDIEQMRQSFGAQREKLEKAENAINKALKPIQNLPRVRVDYIKPEDLKPQKSGSFLRRYIENPVGVALRLNDEYIKPLAEIAEKTHMAARQVEKAEKLAEDLRGDAVKYRKLTQSLQDAQILNLEKQAGQFREDNQQEAKLAREQRLEKSRGRGGGMSR